jgi:hypothetical protein
MGPRNAYKDMLDNVVSPITCVSMNHQNQLKQMANEAIFATSCTSNSQSAQPNGYLQCSNITRVYIFPNGTWAARHG